MPKYKNIKTGLVVDITEEHYNTIKVQGFYVPDEDKPQPSKKKAVAKKSAKKKVAKKVVTKDDVS